MFDRSGLVYMVIRRQAVSMRISDFQLNASEILTAANLHRAMRDKLRRKFVERGIASQATNGRRKLWVPFPDGVFLCQAVGLEDDLKPLLSYSSLTLPPRSENYLLDSQLAELEYDDRVNVGITAHPRTQPSRRQNTAVHDGRANNTRPRCNQCIEKHKRCDRNEICSCCKTSGLGNLLSLDWV